MAVGACRTRQLQVPACGFVNQSLALPPLVTMDSSSSSLSDPIASALLSLDCRAEAFEPVVTNSLCWYSNAAAASGLGPFVAKSSRQSPYSEVSITARKSLRRWPGSPYPGVY